MNLTAIDKFSINRWKLERASDEFFINRWKLGRMPDKFQDWANEFSTNGWKEAGLINFHKTWRSNRQDREFQDPAHRPAGRGSALRYP